MNLKGDVQIIICTEVKLCKGELLRVTPNWTSGLRTKLLLNIKFNIYEIKK
jgi:hypothetical protein